MDYDKIKDQFGNWGLLMKELIESETFNNLYSFLKQQSQQGKEILPKSTETWKSLQLCDRTKIKAIILLQCPYATKREGKVIASGIPISCENIAPYKQPSLYQWEQAIEAQYGFDPDNDFRCDISYLLSEEHVLLMNTSMTVELQKVDSHQQQWHEVTRWFIEHIVNKYLPGIPIVLVGSQAQKFEKYLNPLSNPILSVEHPAAAAYQNRDWKHQNMHMWINEVIRANNGPEEMVMWTRKKGEVKREKTVYPQQIGKQLPSAQELGMPWNE